MPRQDEARERARKAAESLWVLRYVKHAIANLAAVIQESAQGRYCQPAPGYVANSDAKQQNKLLKKAVALPARMPMRITKCVKAFWERERQLTKTMAACSQRLDETRREPPQPGDRYLHFTDWLADDPDRSTINCPPDSSGFPIRILGSKLAKNARTHFEECFAALKSVHDEVRYAHTKAAFELGVFCGLAAATDDSVRAAIVRTTSTREGETIEHIDDVELAFNEVIDLLGQQRQKAARAAWNLAKLTPTHQPTTNADQRTLIERLERELQTVAQRHRPTPPAKRGRKTSPQHREQDRLRVDFETSGMKLAEYANERNLDERELRAAVGASRRRASRRRSARKAKAANAADDS